MVAEAKAALEAGQCVVIGLQTTGGQLFALSGLGCWCMLRVGGLKVGGIESWENEVWKGSRKTGRGKCAEQGVLWRGMRWQCLGLIRGRCCQDLLCAPCVPDPPSLHLYLHTPTTHHHCLLPCHPLTPLPPPAFLCRCAPGEAADAAAGVEPGAVLPGFVSTTKEMMVGGWVGGWV